MKERLYQFDKYFLQIARLFLRIQDSFQRSAIGYQLSFFSCQLSEGIALISFFRSEVIFINQQDISQKVF
ncbi:MAG: hypothetical protein F6K39_34585 [Okeania sp. SIO3B3]|nr:hypothetical protein [Okeania sp. SIO3B3]